MSLKRDTAKKERRMKESEAKLLATEDDGTCTAAAASRLVAAGFSSNMEGWNFFVLT